MRPSPEQVAQELMCYIGERIKTRLDELGITQSEIARLIGRHRSYVCRAISRPGCGTDTSIMQLAKMADALHLRIVLELPSYAAPRPLTRAEKARNEKAKVHYRRMGDPEYNAQLKREATARAQAKRTEKYHKDSAYRAKVQKKTRDYHRRKAWEQRRASI